MLAYNEVTKKKFIILDGEPYEVLDSHVFRKQQRKPVNQAKLRNMITGKVREQSFGSSEQVEEAEVDKVDYKYLYNHKNEYWFCPPNNPGERFSVDAEKIPSSFKFVKANDIISTLVFNDEIIGFNVPIKVTLKVKEAPPAVKGNTAQGATKAIVLETGATVQAPLFINTGDLVDINTEKEDYAGRAEKK